jgi:hypothetical protein
VAPFFVLVLVGLFPGILLHDSSAAAKRNTLVTVAVSACIFAATALLVAYHVAGFPRSETKQLNLFVQIATELNTQHVQPGDDIAIIGDSSDGCRWARLARVRIVAELLRGEVTDFWRSSPRKQAAQSRVIEAETHRSLFPFRPSKRHRFFSFWQ